MFFGSSLTSMLATLCAVLIAITLHETAHGYVAYRLGDPTAKNEGRLSLNPIKHLDPFGALLMFVAGFGWAKPVPVNPYYFKGDKTKGMMLVSVAGPAMNLIICFVAYLIYVAGNGFFGNAFLSTFLQSCVTLNVYLAVFNLIPIPPLDGSKILAGFLPREMAYKFLTVVERYGMLILFALIIFNLTDIILVPIANGILNVFSMILQMIF